MPINNPLERNRATESEKNLPRQQRIAVVFLAVVVILIIVLWALQLNAQLNRPFSIPKKLNTTASSSVTDLHLVDSDGDGLSDYDEINVYHTSPYLEDSDSDGINDKQEILQGTDPNCPTGQTCNALESSPTNVASSTDVQADILPVVSGDEASIVPNIGNEVTPATLRQILLQNGYDQATLDKISDEDIMRSYQEAINTQSSSTTVNSNDISQ